jgi:hypothetical protein
VNDLEKKNQKKTDELVSNRVLSLFATGAILLWALAYLYKLFDYIPTTQTAYLVSKIILGAAGVAFAACLVWLIVSVKKNTFVSTKIINPATLMGLFGVIAVCCGLLLYNYILGMKLIYVFIPAIVVYYLIYNVYQRAFFGIMITHGLMAFALYFMSNSASKTGAFIYGAICILICVFAALVGMAACKNNGAIKLGKYSVRIFDKASLTAKKTILAVYGASAIAALAALFIPVYAIIYIFYAFIAFLVCCAVYYTIRLM